MESQVGIDTTFTIVLPFRRKIDSEAPEDTQVVHKESLHGMNVLLVEDNMLNLESTDRCHDCQCLCRRCCKM